MFTRFLTIAFLTVGLVSCGSEDTPAPKKETPKKEVPKKTPTKTPTKTPPKTEVPACDTDMSDLQKRAQTVAEDYALTKAETLRFKIILAKSFKKAPTSCEDFQDLEMAISDFNTLLGGSLEVCAIIAPSDASIVDGNPAVSPSGDCSIDFIQFDIVSLEKELAPLNKELEDRRDKKVSDAIKAKEFAKAVEAAAPLVKELVAFNKANDFSNAKAVIANNGKIRPAVTKMIDWLTLRTGRGFTIGLNLGLQFRGIGFSPNSRWTKLMANFAGDETDEELLFVFAKALYTLHREDLQSDGVNGVIEFYSDLDDMFDDLEEEIY